MFLTIVICPPNLVQWRVLGVVGQPFGSAGKVGVIRGKLEVKTVFIVLLDFIGSQSLQRPGNVQTFGVSALNCCNVFIVSFLDIWVIIVQRGAALSDKSANDLFCVATLEQKYMSWMSCRATCLPWTDVGNKEGFTVLIFPVKVDYELGYRKGTSAQLQI